MNNTRRLGLANTHILAFVAIATGLLFSGAKAATNTNPSPEDQVQVVEGLLEKLAEKECDQSCAGNQIREFVDVMKDLARNHSSVFEESVELASALDEFMAKAKMPEPNVIEAEGGADVTEEADDWPRVLQYRLAEIVRLTVLTERSFNTGESHRESARQTILALTQSKSHAARRLAVEALVFYKGEQDVLDALEATFMLDDEEGSEPFPFLQQKYVMAVAATVLAYEVEHERAEEILERALEKWKKPEQSGWGKFVSGVGNFLAKREFDPSLLERYDPWLAAVLRMAPKIRSQNHFAAVPDPNEPSREAPNPPRDLYYGYLLMDGADMKTLGDATNATMYLGYFGSKKAFRAIRVSRAERWSEKRSAEIGFLMDVALSNMVEEGRVNYLPAGLDASGSPSLQ